MSRLRVHGFLKYSRSEAGARLLAEMSGRVFTQASKINNTITKCGVTVSPKTVTQGDWARRGSSTLHCFNIPVLWLPKFMNNSPPN